MKTIELSTALANAPAVENLKGFTGVDAANAIGQMTPERLAAVAGGFKCGDVITNTNADDLKTQGLYHLGNNCTPSWTFVIVFVFGTYVLQLCTSDGGLNFRYRAFNGSTSTWSDWSK